MKSTLDARVAVSPEVMLQEIEGESVLLDLKSECYFGLDPIGTRMWRLIERDGSLRSVHGALLEEYDVEPARLEQDLEMLIEELAKAGLVTIERQG